jgi:hypothetical protein
MESEASERCLSDSSPEGKREGVWGNRSGFSNLTPSEDLAFLARARTSKEGRRCDREPQSVSQHSTNSALAGVEGELHSSTHPWGGRAGNGKPAKGPRIERITAEREGFYIRSVSASNCNQGG